MSKEQVIMTGNKIEPHQDEERSLHTGEVHGASLGRGELEVAEMRERISILRKLRAAESWMDKKFGIETTGADRIPENQRRPPSIINMVLIWFSMNVTPGLITAGILGPLLGLSVNDSIVISVFGTGLGSVIPAFCATLSAPTGLRQIAVSRYAFGIWGAKFCGLLNIFVNIGFGTIDLIVAGQLISAVSGGKLTIVVGIVIVCVGSFILSLFGFRIIHRYEQVAWSLILILIAVQFGESAKYFTPTPALSYSFGITRTAAALNYFSLCFGQAAGWCSIAGDYYVHYPANINKWLVFGLTWIGIVVPTAFVLILGNEYGGIVLTNPDLSTIYDDGGIGALILATMNPTGYAKFVCIIYAFSFFAGVTAIYYSSSLSIQLWGKHFIAVPRFVWNTVLAGISLALAWGGREHLENVIVNFLSLLGYWTICFGVVLAYETFWFRPRNGGYDLEGWQDQDKMPWGIAGCVTLAAGIGLSFLGVNQTWYVGPAARAFGETAGDVGIYITLAAVLLAYPPLRHYELKFLGR